MDTPQPNDQAQAIEQECQRRLALTIGQEVLKSTFLEVHNEALRAALAAAQKAADAGGKPNG